MKKLRENLANNKPKKSNKFGSMSLYYGGVYYFPSDIKERYKGKLHPRGKTL